MITNILTDMTVAAFKPALPAMSMAKREAAADVAAASTIIMTITMKARAD